jgi:predicted nucleic acid-binding protein
MLMPDVNVLIYAHRADERVHAPYRRWLTDLVAHPRCRMILPGADHWRHLAELCRATKATGKAVADAQHAAVAIARGVNLGDARR